MSHKNSIVQLTSFKIASVFFIGVAILSSVVIVNTSDLVWSFYHQGFTDFVIIFDFPLKCMAGYLAVIGLISLNHRSVQTQHQLILTEENNKFTNYYKHIDEFGIYVESLNCGWKRHIDQRLAHRKLFPNVKKGFYVTCFFSKELLLQLKELCSSATAALKDETIPEQITSQIFNDSSQVELGLLWSLGIQKTNENRNFTVDMKLLKEESHICISLVQAFKAFDYTYQLMSFDEHMFDDKYFELVKSINSYIFSYGKYVDELDHTRVCKQFPVGKDLMIKKITEIEKQLIQFNRKI